MRSLGASNILTNHLVYVNYILNNASKSTISQDGEFITSNITGVEMGKHIRLVKCGLTESTSCEAFTSLTAGCDDRYDAGDVIQPLATGTAGADFLHSIIVSQLMAQLEGVVLTLQDSIHYVVFIQVVWVRNGFQRSQTKKASQVSQTCEAILCCLANGRF